MLGHQDLLGPKEALDLLDQIVALQGLQVHQDFLAHQVPPDQQETKDFQGLKGLLDLLDLLGLLGHLDLQVIQKSNFLLAVLVTI